jgi:hypothetical protein
VNLFPLRLYAHERTIQFLWTFALYEPPQSKLVKALPEDPIPFIRMLYLLFLSEFFLMGAGWC